MRFHLEFAAVPGEELASPVRELLAVSQVQPLDVVAVLGKRGQGGVAYRLGGGQGDLQLLGNIYLAPIQAETF